MQSCCSTTRRGATEPFKRTGTERTDHKGPFSPAVTAVARGASGREGRTRVNLRPGYPRHTALRSGASASSDTRTTADQSVRAVWRAASSMKCSTSNTGAVQSSPRRLAFIGGFGLTGASGCLEPGGGCAAGAAFACAASRAPVRGRRAGGDTGVRLGLRRGLDFAFRVCGAEARALSCATTC